MVAEVDDVRAWSQVALSVVVRGDELRGLGDEPLRLHGIIDGALAVDAAGQPMAPFFLVVEAKRALDAVDPLPQLQGAMLTVALQRLEDQPERAHGVYSCFTIGDAWTFVRGARGGREHAAIDRALLDLLDVAAMSLDPSGGVVRSNPAAQALLARGDGLRLDEGRVRCVRLGADEALQRASGRRPLLVFVSAVRGVGGGERRPVAVLVRDVDGPGPHAEEVLKGLFGLTPAETRLTLAIAEGQSLAEAAEAFGCARETMRTHLSRVFDKTATTRQAELVRLVLGELPPALAVSARRGR